MTGGSPPGWPAPQPPPPWWPPPQPPWGPPPLPYWPPPAPQWPPRRPGPAPGLAYAGFWIRVGAALIDGVILVGTLFALGTAAGAVPAAGTGGAMTVAALTVTWLLGYVALQIWVPGRYGGTVGMRLLGMWVVREQDGSQIGYALAAGRFGVALVLIALPLGLLADGLLVAFDRRKQAIHDKACSTLVVRRAA